MQILPNYLFFKIFMQSAILQYSLQTKQTENFFTEKKLNQFYRRGEKIVCRKK